MKKRLIDSTKWRKLRMFIISQQPFCSKCRTSFDLEVDHIIEHRSNKELFFEISNLQVLCKKCHGHKSNKFKQLLRFKNLNNCIYLINSKEGIEVESLLFSTSAANSIFWDESRKGWVFKFNNKGFTKINEGKIIDAIISFCVLKKEIITCFKCFGLDCSNIESYFQSRFLK